MFMCVNKVSLFCVSSINTATIISSSDMNLPKLLAVSIFGAAAYASATTIIVPSSANIFGSGHFGAASTPAPSGGGGGSAPPVFSLSAGLDRVLTFSSVTGSVDFGSATTPTGPDGGNFGYQVASFNGIAGITGNASGFLVGVFLDANEPTDPAPAPLDFTVIGTSFTTLSPQLRQVFFIGDGLTGTSSGTVQQFTVPATATRLYLGLADSFEFNATPGSYHDNTGSFTATFDVVPEPSSLLLLLSGAALCLRRRALRTYERST
jgi:hypothetical protein